MNPRPHVWFLLCKAVRYAPIFEDTRKVVIHLDELTVRMTLLRHA